MIEPSDGSITLTNRERVPAPAYPHDQHEWSGASSAGAEVTPRSRRAFLKLASALSASVAALLVGVPTVRAFLSPALKKPAKKGWVKIAQADDIDIETPIKVDFVEAVDDAWVETRQLRTVWLRTDDGETFTAFSGACTHLGCSFGYDKGRNLFVCPCHRGAFDPKTGAVLSGPPPRSLDPLPVRVVKGEVQVMLKQFRSGIAERVEV